MATVRFYIRSKVNKLAPVYVQYRDGKDLKIRLMTPYKLYPDYWNEKGQKLKPNILYSGELTEATAKDIEDKFDKLKDRILRDSFDLTGKPTTEWLQGVIDTFYYKDVPKVKPETFREYFDRFYNEAKAGTRLATVGTTKRRYSYESIRSIRGTKLSVEMFMDESKRKSDFMDISIDWYNDFLQFYFKRGCGANYLGRHIKMIKTVMRAARDEGLHQNVEIERKSFKTLSEKSDSIYLTEEEVRKLYEKDLSKNPLYDKVRDVFLAGVYTAQRYSDYSHINKGMIKEEGGVRYIELTQQKTGEKCLIPMRPELEAILKKYNYTLPKTFEQKVNFNIKKIGKDCEITDPISIEIWQSGMRVKKTLMKCDLIKTHTARRTGCTLMYLSGIPTIDIMKISGHRTEKEFLKYIKVGKKETAMTLAKHPYFMGNPLSIAK
jgi:hypothetical protein